MTTAIENPTYSKRIWKRVSSTVVVCEGNENHSVKYSVRNKEEVGRPYVARVGSQVAGVGPINNRYATLAEAMALVEGCYEESWMAQAPKNSMDETFGFFNG